MSGGNSGRGMVGRLALLVHGCAALGPPWLIRGYFRLMSLFSRSLLPRASQRRLLSSMRGRAWPEMVFAPCRITLGRQTAVRLIPHRGEFDEQALYSRRLDYEPAVFDWLEQRASDYDLVIEIGANIGVYSVFLDALARRRPVERPLRIVAFEPSSEAYRRLQMNLAANDACSVTAFRSAVGETFGQRTFYEPADHLTNGSFVRTFAEKFSSNIVESTVAVVGPHEIETWLKPSKRALIKIDVEGFEPQLLEVLRPLIERYNPDLLIEVLPDTVEALAIHRALAGYERFLITGEGPQKFDALYFSQQYFDWLLTWPRA